MWSCVRKRTCISFLVENERSAKIPKFLTGLMVYKKYERSLIVVNKIFSLFVQKYSVETDNTCKCCCCCCFQCTANRDKVDKYKFY